MWDRHIGLALQGGPVPSCGMLSEFRQRFWLPPRAHGEIIEDRTVSFLELFYDLVYVVVVGRAAHALATHMSWRALGEFTVVFSLIWIAWLNGTLYYELHGREEGRTRTFVFAQILSLVVLGVYADTATGEGGVGFAVAYAVDMLVLTWLWYTVRRQDSLDFEALTRRYLIAMIITIAVVVGSVAVPQRLRVIVWAALVLFWLFTVVVLARMPRQAVGVVVTESLVERFGLFVIIVLGEVAVGVVGGMSDADVSLRVVGTGLLGTMIGFAYWWTYFDYVGRRLPRDEPSARTWWMVAHLPVTLAIASAGAAMVSLVEHAADVHTPPTTAWVLATAVAVALLALTGAMRTLRDFARLESVYRPLSTAMMLAAVGALVMGWLAPAPWLLALLIVLILGAVWLLAVSRWLSLEDPTAISPNAGQ